MKYNGQERKDPVPDYVHDLNRNQRKRNRVRNLIRQEDEAYFEENHMEFPPVMGRVQADSVARAILGGPSYKRVGACIRHLQRKRLEDEIAKRFMHSVLHWTFDMRKSRLPKVTTEDALRKLDECSVGRVPPEEIEFFFRYQPQLPNRPNGPIQVEHREDLGSYKRWVFKDALSQAVQYGYRQNQALEMVILAAAVNVQNQNPIPRQIRVLQQLRQ